MKQQTTSGKRRGRCGWITSGERGQSLVEFALTLPLILVLIFGLVDFGRAFHAWLLVTNAAREGARVGATQAPLNQIQTRVNESIAGLDSSDLTIQVQNVQGDRGQTIVVDLTYSFQYVTPIGDFIAILGGGGLATPQITGHSSMRLE